MAKLNEILDQTELRSKYNYVDECWEGWRESRQSTLKRITGYLFTLNAGALISTLAYVASKSSNRGLLWVIGLFSLGILCSVLHATIDYYSCESYFKSYKNDVKELYENKIDWEVFVDRNEKRVGSDWFLQTVGWVGGVSFFVGLIIGIINIK